jgi:hypothetical protein
MGAHRGAQAQAVRQQVADLIKDIINRGLTALDSPGLDQVAGSAIDQAWLREEWREDAKQRDKDRGQGLER